MGLFDAVKKAFGPKTVTFARNLVSNAIVKVWN